MAHPELLPPKGAYINIHAELMSYFSRNLWRKIWEALSKRIADNCNLVEENLECNPEKRLAVLDLDGDGEVTVEEMQRGLESLLGYKVDSREMTLAQFVHDFADVDKDGRVTLDDFIQFCDELEDLYESSKWRLSFPKEADVAWIKQCELKLELEDEEALTL